MSYQNERPSFYDDTMVNQNDYAVVASKIKTKLFDREIVESSKPLEIRDTFYIRPWRVSFNIPSSQVDVIFEVTEALKIGRSPQPDQPFDGLDLSPFNGFELGVSRFHAEISLQNEQIIIIDKGSSNGTLLNQQRLDPETPYLVKHGDNIMIGNMPVHIHFLTPIFQTE